MNVLQTTAKALFDLDPTVTEQLAHHFMFQTMAVSHGSMEWLAQFGNLCADSYLQLSEGLREAKLDYPHL